MKLGGMNNDEFSGEWSELDQENEIKERLKKSTEQFNAKVDEWGFDDEQETEEVNELEVTEIPEPVVCTFNDEEKTEASETSKSEEDAEAVRKIADDIAKLATERYLEKEKIEAAKNSIAMLDQCLDQLAEKFDRLTTGKSDSETRKLSASITALTTPDPEDYQGESAVYSADHWRNLPSTHLHLESLKGIGKKTCDKFYTDYPTMGDAFELFQKGLHHIGLRGEKANRVSMQIMNVIEELGAV